MTATNDKRYCMGCGAPLEGDHIDPWLCNLCHSQRDTDLNALDSDATGTK